MTTDAARPDPNRWKALAVLSIAYLMVVLDVSIVNVALPSIQTDLGFSPEDLQWVVSGYSLTFGGFLLLGGRAGDLLGRRRLFMIGLAGFAVFSLLCAVSQTDTMLIIARLLQGAASALLAPSVFSITLVTFQEGAERNKALGILGAIAGAGAAIGVLLGGVLTEYAGWEWVFWINVPIGIATLIVVRRYVQESRVEGLARNFDAFGAITVTASLLLLVFGLTQANQAGWGSAQTIGVIAASVVLMAIFLFIEARNRHALMPLSFFKRRTPTGANIVGFLLGIIVFSMFFLLSLYMQQVLGFSALETGVGYLAVALTAVVASGVAQALVTRMSVKPILAIGMAANLAGLIWFSQIPVDGSYLTNLFGPFLLIGVGLGFSFVPVSIAALAGVPPREAGLASGLINTQPADRRRPRGRHPHDGLDDPHRGPARERHPAARGPHRRLQHRLHGGRRVRGGGDPGDPPLPAALGPRAGGRGRDRAGADVGRAGADATRVVRAGLPPPAPGDPLRPPPVLAAPYHLPARHEDLVWGYGRRENPTWTAFEAALGELEGGEAVVLASGMAAATSVLQSLLRPGDALAIVSDGYYTIRRLIEQELVPAGVEVRSAPTADPALAGLAGGAALLWLESPSNPGLDVCDIAALAEAAHRGGGAGGGRQQRRHAARAATARAGRRPVGRLRLKGADRPRRPRPGARRGPRPRARRAPAELAAARGRRARAAGGLARPPLARHPRRPPGAPVRQRPRDRRGRSRPARARARCATRCCPGTRPMRWPRARCAAPGACSRSTSGTSRPPTASSPRSRSSTTPPASAAYRRRPSGGPAGAATTARPASCG